MALATLATTAPRTRRADSGACLPFTRWHRDMDGARLSLVVEAANGAIAECIELDVRQLPSRPDLLARLGPVARERLLREAYDAPVTEDEQEVLIGWRSLAPHEKVAVFAACLRGSR